VSVETQGTKFPDWLTRCDLVTLSPKPPSSHMPPPDLDVLRAIGKSCIAVEYKFVVASRADYEFARQVMQEAELFDNDVTLQVCTPQELHDCGVMDIETLRGAVMSGWQDVSAWAMADQLNVAVLPQLHALAFGYDRGK
jgi:7-carboxy-7-deazaguanine synthase